MICLDTNYLINALREDSSEIADLIEWVESGETLIVAMPSWYEFICGPVSGHQIAAVRAFLTRSVPFAEEHAIEAARLFNACGRLRSLRVDAMIAATAILSGARLATANKADFRRFVPLGLELA